MKPETGARISLELVKGWDPATITSAQSDGILRLYTDIIGTNDKSLGDLQRGALPRNYSRLPGPSNREFGEVVPVTEDEGMPQIQVGAHIIEVTSSI